jgi:hypothetical protein
MINSTHAIFSIIKNVDMAVSANKPIDIFSLVNMLIFYLDLLNHFLNAIPRSFKEAI